MPARLCGGTSEGRGSATRNVGSGFRLGRLDSSAGWRSREVRNLAEGVRLGIAQDILWSKRPRMAARPSRCLQRRIAAPFNVPVSICPKPAPATRCEPMDVRSAKDAHQGRHAKSREALMRIDLDDGVDRHAILLHAGTAVAVRAHALKRSVLEQVGHGRQHRRALPVRVDRPHANQAARVRYGHGPQHERVERTEYRGAQTDAERESTRRAERERW